MLSASNTQNSTHLREILSRATRDSFTIQWTPSLIVETASDVSGHEFVASLIRRLIRLQVRTPLVNAWKER